MIAYKAMALTRKFMQIVKITAEAEAGSYLSANDHVLN